ncbi:MAG: hypothetical protein ABIS17_04750 [Casimicrobiaceae bacterium]
MIAIPAVHYRRVILTPLTGLSGLNGLNGLNGLSVLAGHKRARRQP